jgi:hypothetical protein
MVSSILSTSIAYYCPKSEELYPCQCGEQTGVISCQVNQPLNLASIFNKVSKDLRTVEEKYEAFVLTNNKIEAIPENALGKLNFNAIIIREECSALFKIHSNAFAHQAKTTTLLVVSAKYVISGDPPYSFYDFINSFEKLSEFNYDSRIGILEDKLGNNLNQINKFYLRVNAIKGSPFSKMNRVVDMVIFDGKLSYIPKGAFKLGNLREKSPNGLKFRVVSCFSKKGEFRACMGAKRSSYIEKCLQPL